MKVIINELETIKADEIVIQCNKVDEKIYKIRDYIEKIDTSLCVECQDEKVLVYPDDIYFIESVDKKTFIYLEEQVLETNLKLYELEDKFSGYGLFRASKSCIVNIMYIKKIIPMLNRNLKVLLKNGDQIIISRRNTAEFKKIIGWM